MCARVCGIAVIVPCKDHRPPYINMKAHETIIRRCIDVRRRRRRRRRCLDPSPIAPSFVASTICTAPNAAATATTNAVTTTTTVAAPCGIAAAATVTPMVVHRGGVEHKGPERTACPAGRRVENQRHRHVALPLVAVLRQTGAPLVHRKLDKAHPQSPPRHGIGHGEEALGDEPPEAFVVGGPSPLGEQRPAVAVCLIIPVRLAVRMQPCHVARQERGCLGVEKVGQHGKASVVVPAPRLEKVSSGGRG